MSRRQRLAAYGPWLLVAALAAAWAVPLLWTLAMALRPPGTAVSEGGLWAGGLSLAQFGRAWGAAPFATYYRNTLLIVAGILACQLVTITLGGYAFARGQFPGRDLLFVIFLLQLMIPADALVVPNYQTIRFLGLLDTRTAVILPYAASAFGTFLLRQTFKQVPRELEEAAQMDGAGPLRTLWHIYLPPARPALVAFGLVSVSYHWNNFFWPLIVTNSPGVRPLTVGLALFAKAVEGGADWSLVTAGTLIVILPLLAFFLIFQRQFVQSFLRSGIK